MAFRFALDSLMLLRRSEQRQQEFLLQKENNTVNALLREIINLDQEIFRIISVPPHERAGAEMQFDHKRRLLLGRKQEELQEQLLRAREQQSLAAAALRKAWEKREALEILRQRGSERYALEESRREQRRQDDWFLQHKRNR